VILVVGERGDVHSRQDASTIPDSGSVVPAEPTLLGPDGGCGTGSVDPPRCSVTFKRHQNCVQCRDMEMLRFFLTTGWVAKTVLVILVLFSLASWSVIFGKWRELTAAARATERFLKVFRKASRLSEVGNQIQKFRNSPLAPMFQAGHSELEAQLRSTHRPPGDASLRVKSLEAITRSLERVRGAELERLHRALPLLATTASATPFIGLFGTVWGIMNTFHAIGATGSTSILTVAPGIAEALINTAAGLLAAIPAVVAYNHMLARVRSLNRRMEDFELEFLNLVERNFG